MLWLWIVLGVLGGLVFLVLALAYLPWLPPFDAKFARRSFKRVPLEGALEHNDRLDEGFQKLANRVEGGSLGTAVVRDRD